MALIKFDGRDWAFVADIFTTVADDQELPPGPVAVSLARFERDRDSLLARAAPLAVALSSEQSPEALARDLPRLSAVFLAFPKFKDGRGYSWARMLRQRFNFAGEIRATGDVLRDQWLFMFRCGITAMALKDGVTRDGFLAAMSEQTVFYQPGPDGRGRIGRVGARAAAE